MEDNSSLATLYQKYNDFQTQEGVHLISRLHIKPSQWILDLGCGTGNITYKLAKQVTPTGKIFALDPDLGRLNVAKNNQSSDIQNIDWHHSTIESFNSLPKNSIDIVYSNYSLHWVKDKKKALNQIISLLKPHGYLIFNCIAEYSKIIAKIEMHTGLTYKEFQNKYPLIQKNEWIALLKEHNFSIIENHDINDFEFNSLDEFLVFWEATTHGKFKRDMLSQVDYKALLEEYPTKIRLFGNETLSILCQSLN